MLKDILIDLVKIPSVSSDISALHQIIAYVESIFDNIPNIYIQKLIFNDKPSLIISNTDQKWVDVVLNGHLDVVPPSEDNQFQPYEKDGKLYARWAGDMKAWDAIMIKLIYDLLKDWFDKKKISLILTTDEEVGWFDWVGKLVEMWYWWDVVLIPDAWSLQEIIFAEKGVIHLEIQFNGRSAHSSRPWLGENAIDNMIRFYQILKSYLEEENVLYMTENRWSSTVNLTMVDGWIWWNIIPDKVKGVFNIRFTEKYVSEEILWFVHKLLERFNWEIKKSLVWEILHTDPNNKFVKKYFEIAKANIENVTLKKEHGASDGRFFASKGSVVILHRPTCGNIHWKRERVLLDDLKKIYDVYKGFIVD